MWPKPELAGADFDLVPKVAPMDEGNSAESQGRRTVRVATSVGCTLVVLGLLWVLVWKVGWWTPGLGLLSVKVAVVVSTGIVASVAWFARRR